MALVQFRHSSRGYKAILRSEAVRADLQRRAEQVRNAAQGQTSATIKADSYIGQGRAGATVIGVPMREESRRRILGGAIDAAR